MTNLLPQKVMKFVRRDGPDNAVVCFLTIEDGGVLEREAFIKYISESPIWIPEKNKALKHDDVGLPGEFISKIMTYAFHDLIECSDWEEYRASHLYRKNECNVKYYPIGRHDTGIWEPWLQDFLGITSSEYKMQCQAERSGIINEQCGSVLSGASLFIMLGALDEWSYVLRKYVCSDYSRALATGYDSEFVISSIKDKIFAYYPIFKYGYRDNKKLYEFSANIRKYTTEKIQQKIVQSAQSI